jgi:plastocyanin
LPNQRTHTASPPSKIDQKARHKSVKITVRGANYGWPPNGYKYKPGVVDPIAVMNPQLAPTGDTFYTGDQIPEWKNDWFYCNYHEGQLRRVRLAPESRDRIVFEEIAKNGCGLNVETGPDGALYYTNSKGIYWIRTATATHLIAAPAADASSPLPTETPLPAGTREEDRDVDVSLSEWKVEPSRTTVPTGQLRFVADNTGSTQHRLRIVGQGIDVRTGDLDAGDSYYIQVDLLPGDYQLFCPLPGHQQQGMQASLTVVGP